jgi:glycosyltransferase involved in cell wall biosynthesis
MCKEGRLKVLFLTVWYPTAQNPVAGIFVREHAKAVALYDDVVVVHLAGVRADPRGLWRMERETDEALCQGLETYRLWHRRSPIPRTSYLLYLWAAFRAFQRLRRRGFCPDVIHAHVYAAGVPAVLIGTAHKIPVVVTEHFSGFLRRTLDKRQLCEARMAFGGSRLVMPVSRVLQEAIESYGIGATFYVVPNVVDTSLFRPASSAHKDGGAKNLLAVGRLQSPDRKGIGYLIAALGLLKAIRCDWHLDIVGDGSGKGSYEGTARELGLAESITFHGIQSKENVAALMRRADVVVVPSLVETFSVVAAEALASGTPVVASRCGGPEDLITDEVGMLVPPGDAGALCEALDHMLDHLENFPPDEISRYAARRFGRARVGAQLHTIYEQASQADAEVFTVGWSRHEVAIPRNWRVLDVGSGHNPHARANVLLDKHLEPSPQTSGRKPVVDCRPMVVGDAQALPFLDQSFDYAIASNIAEHVEDPVAFCGELCRVARRGCVECPSPLAELLLGEPFHLWLVQKRGGALLFTSKPRLGRAMQRTSDLVYSLYYAGRARSRQTLCPRGRAARWASAWLAARLAKVWTSRVIRRYTYTFVEFSGDLKARVVTV